MISFLVMFWLIIQVGFGATDTAGINDAKKAAVTLTDESNYFRVTLDYTKGAPRRQIGEALGAAILKAVPDYERLVDSYIAENIDSYEYPEAFYRVADLKINLNRDYLDEIEGIASQFSGGTKNVRRDGKISRDEFILFNLFPDIIRGTGCNFISVFGKRSATGKTILSRALDWYAGDLNQLPQIQALITFKYPTTQICSIGYLGYQGIITGFSTNHIFAGIIDSQTGAPFSSLGKRSYPLDLRWALETKTTLKEAAAVMLDPHNNYAVNHVICMADSQQGIIIENNFSGQGTGGQQVRRAIRNAGSRLNKGISWGIDNAVASVNSFLLKGNTDNQTPNTYNTKRWKNLKKQLLAKGPVVTREELKEVAVYDDGAPGTFADSGDLYNRMTLHLVIFEPDTFSLEIFFHPRNSRQSPADPKFIKVTGFIHD